MLLNRVLKTNSFRECAPKIALSLSPEALFSPKCTKYRLAVGQSLMASICRLVSQNWSTAAAVWYLLIIHTHPFNGPFSGTTQVSRYQKGKTNLYFTEARDSEWQWLQLGHVQVCKITTPAPHHSVFYRPGALPAIQPTASKHWRQNLNLQLYMVKGKRAHQLDT